MYLFAPCTPPPGYYLYPVIPWELQNYEIPSFHFHLLARMTLYGSVSWPSVTCLPNYNAYHLFRKDRVKV